MARCYEAPGYGHDGTYDITDIVEEHADELKDVDFIVLRTGFEELVGQEDYFEFADFAINTGDVLKAHGLRGIGFDAPSLGKSGPEHKALLSQDLAIFESLVNLKDLVGKKFFLSCAPLKFEDGDGSPVRAYAITDFE
jgi:kynurenine formamidase